MVDIEVTTNNFGTSPFVQDARSDECDFIHAHGDLETLQSSIQHLSDNAATASDIIVHHGRSLSDDAHDKVWHNKQLQESTGFIKKSSNVNDASRTTRTIETCVSRSDRRKKTIKTKPT
jgi:hypothetical protein